MQVQVDINFDDLLKIVRTLPSSKRKLLRDELGEQKRVRKSKSSLEALLLKGPVATKRQLSVIEGNRKAINQWRAN